MYKSTVFLKPVQKYTIPTDKSPAQTKRDTYLRGNIIKSLPCFVLMLLSLFSCDRNTGFSVERFGAKGDGIHDDTKAFQAAVEAASAKGGVVTVGEGRFLLSDQILLKGVTLKGVNSDLIGTTSGVGSVICVKFGHNDETQKSPFKLESTSALKGITIYYPDQEIENIVPYPYAIQIGDNEKMSNLSFDCTVENVTFINCYNGIHAGAAENGRHRIRNVNGCVLRRGIFVESVGDVGRIENVHFHCHYWSDKGYKGDFWKAFKYMQHNLEAFIIGRSDWEYITNTFVFPARVGYHFMATDNGNGWEGGPNGQFSGIAADACGACIKVDEIQDMGLLITNGQFNAHLTGDSTQIIISENCKGSVRFVNCGFWGPVKHNVIMNGSGYLSLSNCYFSNNYYDPKFYSVVLNSGNIQINTCTFDGSKTQRDSTQNWAYVGDKQQPPSIYIGKDVKHAIITGNNGYNGVYIHDCSNKAILSNNEKFKP